MQKFLRTLMLVALMAVPFASQAQNTTEREYLSEDFSAAASMWTGGTTHYTGYSQLEPTATPSWTYADLAQNGLAAGHYYFTLQGERNQWLVSPMVDLTESGDAALSFDVALTALSGTSAPASLGESKKFMVLASTDGLNWTPLQTWTVAGEGNDSTLASITPAYRNYTLNLQAYLGQEVYLAFYVENNDRQNPAVIHVDNVLVNGHVACLAVRNVAATTVTTNSISIAWENVNPQVYAYNVIVKDAEGNTLDSAEITNRNQTLYTKENLEPATNYTFKVRVSCDGNDWLEAAPITVFTHYPVNVTLPYENDFEGVTPLTGWTIVNDTHSLTNGWYVGREAVGFDTNSVDTTYAVVHRTGSEQFVDSVYYHYESDSWGSDTWRYSWEEWINNGRAAAQNDIDNYGQSQTWDSTYVYKTINTYDTSAYQAWDNADHGTDTLVFKYIVDADTTWNHRLWISDDGGLTNHYTRHESVTYESYAYMTVSLDSGDYNLGFDWRDKGESANWESIHVYLANEDKAPKAGMKGISNWREITATGLWNKDTWQKYYNTFTVAEAGNYHLVFYWKNDGVNNQPPAAIDNLIFNKVICDPVTDVAVVDSLTTGTTLTVSFTGLGEEFEGSYRGVAKAGNVTVEATPNEGDSTMTFTGLKGETTYSIVLYTVCGEDNESNPTAAISGTTLPTCYAVESLAVIADSTTANRLDIAWVDTLNTGATYEVRVMKGADTVAIATTQDTSFSIDTLVSSTTYTFYVRTICAAEDSAKVRSVSGQTAMEFFNIDNYVNNFNGSDAADRWVFLHASGNNSWYIGTPTNSGFTGSLFVSDNGTDCKYSTGSATRTAAMLPIHLEEGDFTYSFKYIANGENNWDYLEAYLVPESANPTTTNLSNMYRSTVPTGWNQIVPRTSLLSAWTTKEGTVTVTAETAGNYFLLFYWGNDGSGGSQPPAAIDDLLIRKVTCGAPTNLAVADRTGSTVDLTWGNDFHADDVTYLVANVGVDTTAVTGVLAYQLTGLEAETDLTVKVAMICDYGDTLWSDAIATRTLGACNVPENLTVSNVARASFDLSWTQAVSNVTDYDLIISDTAVVDFDAWTPIFIEDTTSYSATNLNRGTTYHVYLRAHCATANSDWQHTTATTGTLVVCNDVTVGNGTATSTYHLPFSAYYHNSYTQQLYTAEEIGLTEGASITQLKFNYFWENTTSRNVTVYLGTTNETSLSSSWITPANMTEVFHAAQVEFSDQGEGWFTLNLDVPFVYDGSNIVVAMYMNRTSEETQYSGTYRFYNHTISGKSRYATSDGAANSLTINEQGVCSSSSGSSLAYRNNIKFYGCKEDDACPTVTELAAADIDVNTATLNWTAADADYLDGYQMILSDSVVTNFGEWTPTTVDASVTSLPLTGLTQATTYYVYLRSLCARDHDTSDWAETSFLTMEACRAATDLAAELVTRNSAHVSWVNGGAALEQAANFSVIWSNNADEDVANYSGANIQTGINATEYTIENLTFDTTWYIWVKNTCTDMSLSSTWLGPVSVTTGIAMPKVINLTAEVTHSTALVTWEKDSVHFAPESEWKIAFQPAASNETPVYVPINHMDSLFIGLQNETSYTVRVISVFGTEESDTAEYTFTTEALPDACAQIGTGTSSAYLLYTSYGNTYSQHIYTAEELHEMGYTAGTINSVSFDYSGTSSSYSKTQSVYIGTTSLDVFNGSTAADFETGLTLVYGPTLNSYQSGWREYEFTTPFVWDGTSNIVVAMLSNSNASSANGWSVRGTSQGTGNYRTVYRYRDNTEIDINDLASVGYGSWSITRPNIKLCFVRESTCLQPTDIVASDITTNSATLSWMPGNSETAWEYTYGLNEAEAMAATPVYTESLNVNLTSLQGDKDYHFYVRAICGETVGDTSAWSHKTFATAISCAQPAQLLYSNKTSNSITLIAIADTTGTPESFTFSYWPDTNTLQAVEVTALQHIIYDTTYNADSTEMTIDTITNRFEANLTNLMPGTKYNFKARTNCVAAEGSSRWTGTYYVTTLCDGTVTLPYTEDFKTTSLNRDCWTLVVADENAETNPARMPNGYVYFNTSTAAAGNESDRYLISPMFNAEDTLVWTSKIHAYNYTSYTATYSYYDSISVGYSMTDNAIESFVWIDKVGTSSGRNFTYYIPTGAKYVAYHYVGRYSSSYVTDVTLKNVTRRTITVASNDVNMGTLTVKINGDTIADSVASVTRTVFDGASVNIYANKADHYHIVNWTNGVTNDTIWQNYDNRSFTLNQDTNLVANFAIDPYTLTVYNMPTDKGAAWVKIDSVVAGVTFYDKDTTFNYGTEITVHALDTVENDHYSFRGWSTSIQATNMDAYVSFSNEYTFTPEATGALYAHFVIDSVNVNATSSIADAGTITGTGKAGLNSTVHMTAEPAYGYEFVRWNNATGDSLTNLAQFDTLATNDMTFTAVFSPLPYYIFMAVNEEAWGEATATPDHGVYGTEITLNATATAEHYHFERWTDYNTENPRAFTLTRDTVMMAYFRIDTHAVQLAAREDMGTVAINGDSINTAVVDYNSEVTVQAIPNDGVQFLHWSDGSVANPYTFTVVKDSNLTAVFDSIVYDVIVRYDDTMGVVYQVNGEVATAIADSAVINALYGDTVTLRWDNLAGFRFVNWTNSLNATALRDTTVNFVVYDSMIVYANFVDASKSNITVASADVTMGTVEGAGQYAYQGAATVNAIAAEHYHFTHWVLNPDVDSIIIDSAATVNFTADSDMVFIAYFAIDTVNFQFASAVDSMGAVEADTVAGYLNYGTEVTLTAVAEEHYHFMNWSDGTTDAIYTLTLTEDTNLVATFAIDTIEVNAVANIEEAGTVTGTGAYPYGETVEMTATANTGYHFVAWSNGEQTDTINYVARVSGATVTANFDTNVYTVAVNYNSEEQRGVVRGTGEVKHFTSTDLVASATYGFHFVNWTNAAGDTISAEDTLNIAPVSDTTLTANFDYNQYTITAATNDSAMGVASVVAPATVNYRDTVVLVATPAEGYHLVSWSNGLTSDTIEVQVLADDTITATFAINHYIVRGIANDAAMGTVEVLGTSDHGTTDTLVAHANYGYHFVNWNNVETAVNDTLTFVVTSDRTDTAIFAKNEYAAAVNVNDTAMGIALVSNEHPLYLDTVTYQANANAHYRFIGWMNEAGDTVSTLNTFKVVVANDTALTATFEAIMDSVHILVNNATMGSVNPAGDTVVMEGTILTITATANEGYNFVNWSNGDTTETINVVVMSDTTLTANFVAIPTYTVTVTVNDSTMGHVEGVPTEAVLAGTELTLVAVAEEGYHFVAWSTGATTDTLNLTVNEDVTLTATFAETVILPDSVTFTFMVNNETMGTVTPNGTVTYAVGTQVTATATAAEGYTFVNWSVIVDGGTATFNEASSYTATVLQEMVGHTYTIIANFAEATQTITVTVTVNDTNMGTVSGAGVYHVGETVTLEAVAKEGYRFVRWSDGNTNALRTFTATEDVTLEAIFERGTGIEDVETVDFTVYSVNNTIVVKGVENMNVYVFDVNGRTIEHMAKATETVEFTVNTTGVYLVKVGNAPAKRVVVVR